MWFAWQIYPLSFIQIAKPIFNVPLQYPIKTAENRRFSVFRVYGSGTLVENWLIEGRGKKILIFVMRCVIWYHLHNLKNVKNIHGGVLILVTPRWVFFTFFKLCNWYQIAQRITFFFFDKVLIWRVLICKA